MKKYRVTCEPEWDYIFITVEAENEEQAKELAEEKFSNQEGVDDDIEYPDEDPSKVDYVTAISCQEIT